MDDTIPLLVLTNDFTHRFVSDSEDLFSSIADYMEMFLAKVYRLHVYTMRSAELFLGFLTSLMYFKVIQQCENHIITTRIQCKNLR